MNFAAVLYGVYAFLILYPLLPYARRWYQRLRVRFSAVRTAARLGARAQRILFLVSGGVFLMAVPYVPSVLIFLTLPFLRKRLDAAMLASDLSITQPDKFRHHFLNHRVPEIRRAFQEAMNTPPGERDALLMAILPPHLAVYRHVISSFLANPERKTLESLRIVPIIYSTIAEVISQMFFVRLGLAVSPLMLSAMQIALTTLGQAGVGFDYTADILVFLIVLIGHIVAGEL